MQKTDVSFAFYYNEFCCGGEAALPAEEFEKYIRRAENVLGGFGVSYCDSFENEIKLCLCEMAELIYSGEKRQGIKAETIDGYSVTFAEKQNANNELLKVALRRLEKSGLMYAGVDDHA